MEDGGQLADRYTLANTDEERRRLERQAEVLRPMTDRLFRAAGLSEGMSVLDIGSGAGVDPEEIAIGTLADRLYAERGDEQLSVVGPLLGVAARRP